MDQKKKDIKVFTSLEIVYITNDYVDRLNKFILSDSKLNNTTAHWNKKIKVKNGTIDTKFYRPMVVFKFDKNCDITQCFPLSSYKSGRDNLNDQRYGYVENNGKIKGKVVLTKPILIPKKYVNIININDELNNEDNPQIKEWLHNLNIEKKEFQKKFNIFWNQYLNIKYSRKVDYIDYTKANRQLIDETKVEEFCKNELKIIENNKSN